MKGISLKEKFLSVFKVARVLGVYPSTVDVWIKDGKLKAVADESGIDAVSITDLHSFIELYNMPVPRDFSNGIKPVILVVDDDDMVRASLTNLLKRFCPDADIVTASGGFEAGQMVSIHVPDLVLLDIMLPGIDGFQACSMIKKQYRDVRILAITGYGTNANRDKMLSNGADGFLSKPVEAEELLEQVNRLLDLE